MRSGYQYLDAGGLPFFSGNGWGRLVNVASALFGVGVFVGPTIGPTLGGFITEHYSWPWIFYINVPIGIAVAVICSRLLGEPAVKPTVGKIDWTGILLLAAGVGALQTVLERGETDDWFAANYIVILTAIAVFGLSLFVWWELICFYCRGQYLRSAVCLSRTSSAEGYPAGRYDHHGDVPFYSFYLADVAAEPGCGERRLLYPADLAGRGHCYHYCAVVHAGNIGA